ncbi:DDE-type integrase/transposase/recombinase [Streptomyces sp. NPDC048663]|uniref:DDE-type integrase/transposase/recombinase n=1 Tax=Streptomyces sp. NPDC048663 TaxID=3155638 RepID=UPI00341B0615
MRERGISGVTRRKRRTLTRPEKRAVPAPDMLGSDFTASAPGMKVVGDITYIPIDEGWLYLAIWPDLATREIVGYSMADHHRASLAVDALRMAAGRSRLQHGCITHSDRSNAPPTNSAARYANWESGRAWDAPARASTVRMIRCRFGRWPAPCFDWRCCLGIDLSATAWSGTRCRRAGDVSR